MIPMRRDDLIVMMEAGYIYLAMQKYAESRAVFEGVSAVAPQSDVPLVAIGNVHFSERHYARAIHFYKRALALVAESAFAKAYLGESLLFQGKKDEAVTYLREASQADKGGATGRFAQSLLDLIHKGFDPHAFAEDKRHQTSIKEAV